MAVVEILRRPATRTFLHGMLWLIAAAACMLALDQLARIQLRLHLDTEAGNRLGMRLHSFSPHRWSGNLPAHIVARQAFSAASYEFQKDGLHFRSGQSPVDVGLVISGNIDLLSHSILHVEFSTSEASGISVIVRESLDAPACISEARNLPAGRSDLTIDLHDIHWNCGNPSKPAPQAAAMLRLHVTAPPAADHVLHSARLQSPSTLAVDDLDRHAAPLLPSARDETAFGRVLQRIADDPTRRHPALLQLPLDARVEQVMVARDRVLAAIPETIIVPKGDLAKVSTQAIDWSASAPRAAWLPWFGVSLLALALAALRWRPPFNPRLRAALELAGVLSAPLGLILGNQIGDNLSPPLLAASVITFTFALSLLFGAAPAHPGSRMLARGFSVALLSIAAASVICVVLGSGITSFELPALPRAARYLAWAAAQQFLVCVIVAGRVEILCGSRNLAILLAALLFALLHAPNAMLMQFTFVGGLVWIWNWQRHRALPANLIAHALCGMLLTSNLPANWLYSAEVSARYFLIGPS